MIISRLLQWANYKHLDNAMTIIHMSTDPECCVEHRDHGGGDETPGEELEEDGDHGVTGGGPLEATQSHGHKACSVFSLKITISQVSSHSWEHF